MSHKHRGKSSRILLFHSDTCAVRTALMKKTKKILLVADFIILLYREELYTGWEKFGTQTAGVYLSRTVVIADCVQWEKTNAVFPFSHRAAVRSIYNLNVAFGRRHESRYMVYVFEKEEGKTQFVSPPLPSNNKLA